MTKTMAPLMIVFVVLGCMLLFAWWKFKERQVGTRVQDILNKNDAVPFVDERGTVINHTVLERQEQVDAATYIQPDDVVLELGARYGTVSCVVNSILKDKRAHVVMEPDTSIIDALKKNRSSHGAEFEIFVGILGSGGGANTLKNDGYGTRVEQGGGGSSPVQTISFQTLQRRWKFNTIIADCEGCFEGVLDHIGSDIAGVRKILLEEDQKQMSDYSRVRKRLYAMGFRLVKDGMWPVFIRS